MDEFRWSDFRMVSSNRRPKPVTAPVLTVIAVQNGFFNGAETQPEGVQLVTGGAGFIGSHLVDALLRVTDERVTIFDDFSTGSRSNIRHLEENDRVTIVDGDLRNREAVIGPVTEATTVYHLGAAVGVERVVNSPLAAIETNLTGTRHVLDGAARDETPVFLASSSEVYGKSTAIPFEESDDLLFGAPSAPRWSYGLAKALDECIALGHHHEHDLPVVIGRFFNVSGPRQTGEYGMVIPRFVSQALRGEPLTVYGDGTQSRCFTHVEDAVEVVLQLMQRPDAKGEVLNIGNDEQVTINELARTVIDLCETESGIRHVPFDEVYGEDFEEPTTRLPDLSKVKSVLDELPQTPLEEIVTDIVEYQKADGDRRV